ncbi:LysR family transcriptional regulator [Paracoccus salsus]|uniref:LysR family transcriptional regulator n=1 Tax=Paracoccus salsus TaxID=2911061 RepID=UPI001F16D7C0|nr:LysR family transcriptional regulator [Paracoccus salsus]MCF3973260.1 LysR family transcriptional regulator [Paracoccus salsus]
MSLPPLNALRAFEAVARTGSFRAAAETLFVTQPAISHQVRHLEEWVGTPLFDRGGRRPVLTARGQALARDLTLAFESIDAACSRARPARRPDALVVAAIPSVAICWLIPRLPRLRERHPRIPLRIVYAHHGEAVDFSEVDLAFVFARSTPQGDGFTARPFLPGASVPVCSPALLADRSISELRPTDLPSMELLHDTDDSGWREWLIKAHVRPPASLPGATFEDFNLLRIAALSGQGIALCSRAMIQPDLESGRLVRLSDITVLEDYGYFLTISNLAERRSGIADARTAFLGWLAEEQAASLSQIAA